MNEVRDIAAPAYADYVLDSLQEWRREGLRTALLTLVGVAGSSPRPLGSQIAVAEDGRAVGAITGGCAEQALVLDALAAIALGRNHVELYGEGSRFKDIVLPCGSGIHVCFDVGLDDATLDALVSARLARRPSVYVCDGPDGRFERVYRPQGRAVIIGQGNIVPLLTQMAALSEFEVVVHSPDETTRYRCAPIADTHPLRGPGDWRADLLDEATALISLFHDHSYEPDILAAGLRSPAFYIGALGSRRTHARRLDDLRAQGWTDDALARIHGPAGLDLGAKTPPEIAVSIMAELIRAWRQLALR